MNAGEWTPLLPKSHAGLYFLHSYECFAAAEAPCKCAASPFAIVTHHHTLLPLPVTYMMPVLPAIMFYLSTFSVIIMSFPPPTLRLLQ